MRLERVVLHNFGVYAGRHELDLRPPIHEYLIRYRAGDPFVSLGRMWIS